MGLFDFLKKDKREDKIEPRKPAVALERPEDETDIYETEEGRKVFELYNAQAKPGRLYDSTKVIVDKEPQIIGGQAVYDCFVSWFGRDDTVFLDESGRVDDYSHVIAGINPGLMETDPEYLSYVMKDLLNKARVERYLKTALMTPEDIAKIQQEEMRAKGRTHTWECGRYIGNVVRNEQGKLVNRFNQTIGSIMHNTAEMQSARAKEQQRQERQAMINAKRKEIAKLQAEMQELGEEGWTH